MIIRYNPPVGADTRTYRQELRRNLREFGAGVSLLLDARNVKPGALTVECNYRYAALRDDTVAHVKRLTRLTNVTLA